MFAALTALLTTPAIELYLRQIVPGFYLFAMIYIGMVSGRQVKWRYLLMFGFVGITLYMVLNEPTTTYRAFWFTPTIWRTLVFLAALGLGVWSFKIVIDREKLPLPHQAVLIYGRKAIAFVREEWQRVQAWRND